MKNSQIPEKLRAEKCKNLDDVIDLSIGSESGSVIYICEKRPSYECIKKNQIPTTESKTGKTKEHMNIPEQKRKAENEKEERKGNRELIGDKKRGGKRNSEKRERTRDRENNLRRKN